MYFICDNQLHTRPLLCVSAKSILNLYPLFSPVFESSICRLRCFVEPFSPFPPNPYLPTFSFICGRRTVQAGAHVGRRKSFPFSERQQPASVGPERRLRQERTAVGREDIPVHRQRLQGEPCRPDQVSDCLVFFGRVEHRHLCAPGIGHIHLPETTTRYLFQANTPM